MKKEQVTTKKRKGNSSGRKRAEQGKKPVKRLVTGTTEILDFNLEEELSRPGKPVKKEKPTAAKKPLRERSKAPKKSKSAPEAYGGSMPKKPVSVGQDTLELLDVEEILAKKKQKKAPGRKESYLDFVPQKKTSASRTVTAKAKKPGAKKKKRGGFFEDFSAMDAVIGLTGVLVLFAAVMAMGVYSSANTLKEQVAAMAEVGQQMEEIGIAGEGIFTAIADAKAAGLEAAQLPVEEENGTGGEYEEKELTREMNVSLKLTSVQKDLKIKFTNKKSGKLIGNQPFAVSVDGPEKMTLKDDDEDGIIYVKSITPGEYSVTITEPAEIDGNQAAGIKGIVTVKDKIEYKKIDVTDEVKKESEINAAKEDTAVANQVESVLTDTVEWVESTKTPLEEGNGETYEEVKKKDIPDPSAKALLDMIWTADTKNGAYLSENTVKLAENAAFFRETGVKKLVKGVFFSQDGAETEAPFGGAARTEATQQESSESSEQEPSSEEPSTAEPTRPPEPSESSEPSEPSEPEPPKGEVTGVRISGGTEYTVGDQVKLRAEVETSGEISLSEEDYQWSGDRSGTGKELTFQVEKEGSISIRLEVKGKTASTSVTVKAKPGEVTGVSVTADPARVEAGKSVTLKASVSMSDGSSYGGNIEWSADRNGQLSGSGTSVTLTDTVPETVTVKARAGGKESSITVEFYPADKKVTSVRIPEQVSVVTGGTAGLSLEIQPGDAKDKSVEWKVTEGGDKASVDQNGTVKGLKAGTAKVQATAKDGSSISSNVCTVKVSDDISISIKETKSIMTGEERQLEYSTTGEIDSIKWSSADTKIASVDESSGKVKGISYGRTTITAKVKGKNGKEASATVNVKINSYDVDEIKLDPEKMTIKAEEKKTIKAKVSSKGSKAVEWKSKDESIAKIVESKDDSCVIQGIKPGKVFVIATSKEDKEKTASCEVTVTVKDGSAPLKDKDGNQLYYKDGDEYKAATVDDYYKYDVFYRKKDTTKYKYTGWQTIDGKRYYFDKNGNPVTGDQIIQGMKYTFNSDGSLQVNGVMGIDVSKHNGAIDWNAVKNAGVNFVIIRCGYRGSATGVLVEDQTFRTNIQGASAAGLKVGIYFFSQAVNEVEAVEEASLVLDLIKKYKITYPVFMDVESANGRADGLDAGARTQVISAFCKTIIDSGYTAGVYANKTWLGSKMNVGALGGYKIWLAQYAAAPTYSGRYEMWQYSSKGSIPGISGNVDLNISYMSY